MRTQNAELINIRRLAEAALLVAVFTVLAFQYIRFEIFETEKNAILGILAAVILGANAAEYIYLRRFPRLNNPLVIAVIAFVVVAFVSTLFSISFSYSVWGSPTRGHGLVTVIIYALLFWQATRSGRRLQEALFPLLTVISVPMCVWALHTYFTRDVDLLRPASTAGNPNYLAGWLVMFLIYFGLNVYWRLVSWERPYKRVQVAQLVLYAGIIGMTLLTLVVLSSRGAIFGLGVGLVTIAIVLGSLLKKRLIMIGVLISFIITSSAYLMISQRYLNMEISPHWVGFERIFIPYDESRIVLWETAAQVIAQQGRPLQDAAGNTDRWAFLRPALGYGLETLEQTQERFDEPFISSNWRDRYVERFHNLFFDWTAEVGSLGLITVIAIYLTAFYLGMRRLGFIRPDQIWYWLGLQLIGAPLGILFFSTIIPQAEWQSLIPVGGAIGALLGTLLWIGRSTFVNSDQTPTLNYDTITVIALFCIVSAQWIDNQFGFMQIVSQTIFFIFLGMLVSLSASPEEAEIIADEEITISETTYWYAGTALTGLFLLYSFGVSIDSQFSWAGIGIYEMWPFLGILFLVGATGAVFTRLQEGKPAQPPVKPRGRSKKQQTAENGRRFDSYVYLLMLTVLIWPVFFGATYILQPLFDPENVPVGFYEFVNGHGFSDVVLPFILFLIALVATGFNWLQTQDKARVKTQSQTVIQSIVVTLLLILLGWQVFFGFKTVLVEVASYNLDQALTSPTGPNPDGIYQAYFLLALNGVTVIILAIGFLFWVIKTRVRFSMGILSSSIVAVFLLIGIIFYVRNFAVGAMRATANGFATIQNAEEMVQPLVAADVIYRVAVDNQPSDVKLRLSWIDALITQIGYWPEPERRQQIFNRIEEQRQAALQVSPFFVNSKTWEIFDQRYRVFRQQFVASQNIPQPTGMPGSQPPIPGASQPPGSPPEGPPGAVPPGAPPFGGPPSSPPTGP